MSTMTSWKRSPLTICCAAAPMLLVLVLFALGLTGTLFGPYEWHWLGLPAFFLAIPSIVLFLWVVRDGFDGHLFPERWPWLRPCRPVVGGIAALCLAATVAGFVGMGVAKRAPGLINSGDEPIIYYRGPYLFDNDTPVSRSRWLAAAVSFNVAWHCFFPSLILGLLYLAFYEPKDLATRAGIQGRTSRCT